MPVPFKTPTSMDELLELQRETTTLFREQLLAIAKNKVTKGARSEAQRAIMLAKYKSEREILAAAGDISEATMKEHHRRGSGLYRAAWKQKRDVWELAEERTSNKQSWYAAKAGLQYFLLLNVKRSKAAIDEWQSIRRAMRSSSPSQALTDANVAAAKKAYEKALIVLPPLANALAATPHGKLPAKFADKPGRTAASKSKARSVTRRPENWREQVAERLSSHYRLLFCIQCVTGSRPVELHRGTGVTVVRRANGDLELTTPGAKIGKHSGQESRQLTVPAKTGIAKMLADMLEVDRPISSASLFPSTVNAYREAVIRAGKRAFPSDKPARRLSPYSARHQFKADVEAAGLTREDQAKAMGHSTTRSATYYGRGARAGSGSVAPTSVEASRVVKQRSPHPKKPTSTAKQSATQAMPAPRRRKPKP